MVFTLIQFGQSLSVSVSRGISSHWSIAINLKINKVNSKMYAVDFVSLFVLVRRPWSPVILHAAGCLMMFSWAD